MTAVRTLGPLGSAMPKRTEASPQPLPGSASAAPWESRPWSVSRLLLHPATWCVAIAIGLFSTPWILEQIADYQERAAAGAGSGKALLIDGDKAFAYLKAICAIGPRVSGTEGMRKQQELLTAHFQKLGAKVERQAFRARHPVTGNEVELANLIVQWHPDRKERILLCTHYDTRPFPDRDALHPRGVFVGANDGGSGTALFMEMGPQVAKLDSKYGVDMVFFDGEELVYGDNDKYFLGSEYFALDYKKSPPAHRYRWGILLDMIGDSRLEIFQEGHSVGWPTVKPLVDELWGVARAEGIHEFRHRPKHDVRDDHLPLNEIAGIPTCDVIDFDYPSWHTTYDVPDRCSGASLAKVGHVLLRWLQQVK